jgi:hypothetical protein
MHLSFNLDRAIGIFVKDTKLECISGAVYYALVRLKAFPLTFIPDYSVALNSNSMLVNCDICACSQMADAAKRDDKGGYAIGLTF